MTTATRKLGFLEAMFQRYSDVPREVVVKEDVLREGVVFAPEAAVGRHTYQLFSWERNLEADVEPLSVAVPNFIELSGGIYGLRRIRVRPRLTAGSPYSVELREGVPTLCAQGEVIAPLHAYAPQPAYSDKTFPNGTRYGDLVQTQGGSNNAYVLAFNTCQYWGPKEECRFCDINENYRVKRSLGQYHQARAHKDPVEVGQVLEEVFGSEQWTPEYRPRFVFITGGQITSRVDGLSEADFYIRYVREARHRTGGRWPIRLEMAPKPRPVVRQFREAGLTCFDHNMEVWDKRLFEWVCPGKTRNVGYDTWVRLMVEAVEELGQGHVITNMVMGVEMARPYGLATVGEAVKSTSEGFDFLMSRGVFPQPTSWCVSHLSGFRDQRTPPLDYFLEIDRAWYGLWKLHRLVPPPAGYCIGPGVCDYPHGGAMDMG